MAVMPRSSPRRSAATAARSVSALRPPQPQPPTAHAPKTITGTSIPLAPRLRVRMARSYTPPPMTPTRKDQRASCPGLAGNFEELRTRPVDDAEDLGSLFEESIPAFGGAWLRKAWLLLDGAIGQGVPMTISIAGPVTLSGQALTWLNPLLETGWFAYLSTTGRLLPRRPPRARRRAREPHLSRGPRPGRRRAARRARHPRHRRRLSRGHAAR